MIADEPTTALDVTIQATILELIRSMIERFNMSLIFITHNLGGGAYVWILSESCMRSHLVELGTKTSCLRTSLHPYGWLTQLDPQTRYQDEISHADHGIGV